jgi:hypothetical protein
VGASKRDKPDGVLVDVEMDEVVGATDEHARTTIRPRRDRDIWLRDARRWWPVAAALSLVVAAATVVADRRESARLAALADVPGVLAPIDGRVAELWRDDGVQDAGLSAFAGRLLGVQNHPDGSIDVVALDPLTGKVAWRTAARPAGASGSGARCAFPSSPRPIHDVTVHQVVACVVVDATATIAGYAGGKVTYPTEARMLVVDATSGAVLSDNPTDPRTTVASIGTDLVIGRVDADGHIRVSRTDPRGTAVRWTFVGPNPVGRAAFASVRVGVVGDLVTVSALDSVYYADQRSGGSSWVLSGGGDVIRSLTADPSTGLSGTLDVLFGGKALAETAPGASTTATTIIDRATGRSFTADASPLAASPDDGSLAGLVLMQSPGGDLLIGYDLASGRPLWTVPGTGGETVIIDGRIIQAGADGLKSIDGHTGETIWATRIEPPNVGAQGDPTAASALLTDGRLVLLAQPGPTGGVIFSAYGLDDGAPLWTSDVADNVSVTAVGGALVGSSTHGLVGLG